MDLYEGCCRRVAADASGSSESSELETEEGDLMKTSQNSSSTPILHKTIDVVATLDSLPRRGI